MTWRAAAIEMNGVEQWYVVDDSDATDPVAIVPRGREVAEEICGLRQRLRMTAQMLIAETGADGPTNAESAAAKVVQLIKTLRAEAAQLRDRLRAIQAAYDRLIGGPCQSEDAWLFARRVGGALAKEQR